MLVALASRGAGRSRALRPALLIALAHGASAALTAIPGYDTTFEIVTAGKGDTVTKGARVQVHATGVVEQTGKKFWSTKDPGQQPFEYDAGVGGVITGWDQGCLGMAVGEVRKLRIPAHEGYGAQGFPAWGIPAGGTLNFEIELLKVLKKGKSEL